MRSFDDIDAFLRHLSRLPAVVEAAEHHGLDAAGERLVHGAQAMIGEEIAQWAPLAYATMYGGVSPSGHPFKGKIELGYTGHVSDTDPLLRTGELRASITYSVQGQAVTIGTDDPIAEFQEFGTMYMPPRPFIGSTMFRDSRAAADLVASYMVAAFSSNPLPHPPPGSLTGG